LGLLFTGINHGDMGIQPILWGYYGDILEILWRTFHRDIVGEQTGEFVDFSPCHQRKVSKMENEPIVMRIYQTIYQFPFQDPKLEVPTIYKAYVREYHHKI
jgi:hypothetical protein